MSEPIPINEIGAKLENIITNKLNDQKHGYILLAVSHGQIKKITWEAGEVMSQNDDRRIMGNFQSASNRRRR